MWRSCVVHCGLAALLSSAAACSSPAPSPSAGAELAAAYGPYLEQCEEVLRTERERAEHGAAPEERSLNAELCAELVAEAEATALSLCEEALAEKRREIARDRSLSGADKARMRAALNNYRCDE